MKNWIGQSLISYHLGHGIQVALFDFFLQEDKSEGQSLPMSIAKQFYRLFDFEETGMLYRVRFIGQRINDRGENLSDSSLVI